MASEYDHLIGEETYGTFSQRWLANVLGANAWGSSFIIGDGTAFTDCPSTRWRTSSARSTARRRSSPAPWSRARRRKEPRQALRHAQVPTAGGDAFARFDNAAVYRDNAQSFTTTEPAIDLTAPSMLAFAWQSAEPSELEPGL